MIIKRSIGRRYLATITSCQILTSAFSAIAQNTTIILEDGGQRKLDNTVTGQVLNGNLAEPGHWPSTFTFRTSERNCTATAVSRRVILIAAHCVDNGQVLAMIANSTVFTDAALTCEHHPDYKSDISADYALCALNKPLSDPAIGFERISTTDSLTRLGQSLLILGYGCTTDTGSTDYGSLYLGYAAVTENSFGPHYFTSIGGAAVCTGDSGGGVYWVKDSSNITQNRLLVGVNSRGDLSKKSWFSSLGSASFNAWARDWLIRTSDIYKVSLTICGLDNAVDHCRPQPL